MEPTLMVVGLNYRTAPVGVRERFWISEDRRYQALVNLSQAEGIEEVIVLATCNRTEFLLWANDVTLAANSVMRLLGSEYGLKLCEWKHFYRLLDEAALLHIFKVASSLDSMVIGEPQVISQVKQAWQQAQKVGATGRFLDAVLQKALTVSKRVRSETAIGNAAVSIPYAAVELARQIFGTLENKKVLLLGAGKMSELSARGLLNHGASSVRVINRTLEHAAELATKLGGVAIPFEERWQHMAEADIVISSTSCPHTILSREEAELMIRERHVRGRKDQPLVIVDIAMPRDIDSAVREVKGVFLYDLDDLENVVDRNAGEREAAAADAQKILQAEAQGFRRRLMAERVVPTIVALRQRLDEICRQELDSFRQENGPFSKDQDEMLTAVMSRMTQRIAGSLARELKELPERVEQEQMTTALQRLFHLQTPERALAGTIST
ncbi:MAG: glutamyl-tRNA reductase, partial [Candidatus Sulfotelmatobacter sp.]